METSEMTDLEQSRGFVSSMMLFANGSLTQFAPPTVTRFEREKPGGGKQQVALYKDMAIFRSGQFADSQGLDHEILPEHIDSAVDNFDYLKESGILPDVPVRVGHPSFLGGNPLKDVAGYITAVHAEDRVSPIKGDSNTYRYLFADYEILDPEVDKKIDMGLYRNRSAEIGTYFTNAPVKEIFPAVMGFAYVDISAVEGMNFAKQHPVDNFSIMTEAPVTTTTATTAAGGGQATTTSEVPKPRVGGVHEFTINRGALTISDPARVQEYIHSLEKDHSEFSAKITSLTSANEALTEFKNATVKSGREDRITMLGKSIDNQAPKLTAPQVTAALAFAANLDESQFEAYMKTLDAAPAAPILQNYGHQSADGGQRPAEQPKEGPDEVKDLTEILHGLRTYSKMSDEQLSQTSSFAKLKALKPEFTLATL